MTIEVLDGERSAALWEDAHGDALTEAAITGGAQYWEWHAQPWGVVLKLCFPNEERWDAYRRSAAVSAALDGVPDRVNGLLIHRGRGGSAGRLAPRPPTPARQHRRRGTARAGRRVRRPASH